MKNWKRKDEYIFAPRYTTN